jgi:hypothetical protein
LGDAARAGQRRHAEIQDLHDAAFGDDDVGGLDVSVNDAPRMGRGEASGDLAGDIGGLLDRERAGRDPIAEELALVIGHADERLAFVGFLEAVDGADVGMVQRRSRLRLLDLAPRGFFVGGQEGREELQDDVAVEPDVPRPVDDAHSAGAEFLEDPVVRNGPADHDCLVTEYLTEAVFSRGPARLFRRTRRTRRAPRACAGRALPSGRDPGRIPARDR